MDRIIGTSIAVEIPGETLDNTLLATIQRDANPDIPFPEHWEFPGGTREPGESDLDCGLREVGEEIGLWLSEADITWRALYPSLRYPGYLNAFYVATLGEAPTLLLGEEGRRCQLMRYGEFAVHPLAVPDHVQRYQDYALGINGVDVRTGGRPYHLAGLARSQFTRVA